MQVIVNLIFLLQILSGVVLQSLLLLSVQLVVRRGRAGVSCRLVSRAVVVCVVVGVVVWVRLQWVLLRLLLLLQLLRRSALR